MHALRLSRQIARSKVAAERRRKESGGDKSFKLKSRFLSVSSFLPTGKSPWKLSSVGGHFPVY